MPRDASAVSRQPGEPYCRVCGYSLVGATASPACPECGTPLVECLVRHTVKGKRGVRRRSAYKVFGLPLWEIATGPDPEKGETHGKAIAWIALGDMAFGGIAVGGVAGGGAAFGGAAFGVVAAGGASLGLLTAMGGAGFAGGLAIGGAAIGGIAVGGGAIGVVAAGGGAYGYYAAGGGAQGRFIISQGRADPEAVEVFSKLEPVLGPAATLGGSIQPVAVSATAILGVAAGVLLIGQILKRKPEPAKDDPQNLHQP